MIPYGRQDIDQSDINAVIDVLKSDFLTQGPVGPRFEQAVAEKVDAARGVSMNSATSALHVACMALDLGPGDLVWTSPNTFVASANCARYCGADVDFVDIDRQSFNMCPVKLEEKLKVAKTAGRLPKIVIPVHLCGYSCDMQAIHQLAGTYGFKIIEDASHAVGGKYLDMMVGSCAYSDIAIFSFHPVKIITSAEGGMAMTNDPQLADRMERLRSHGITRDPDLMTHAADGPWYYQQLELGYNYRMTEMQAALGLQQMARLDPFVAARHALAERYDTLLGDLSVRVPKRRADIYSAFHLYVIQVEDVARHRSVFEALRENGIGVNLHYIPVHLQPYYRTFGFAEGDFPVAEDYYSRAISIPLYPAMTHEMQDSVVAALSGALSA